MSQKEVLLQILSDGRPHPSFELMEQVYGFGRKGGRLAARVNDLKAMGHQIASWRDRDVKGMWWYMLEQAEAPEASVPPVQQQAQTSMFQIGARDR